MSGHSKWATTKHKKAAIDAKRGKLFAKLIKNIEVAARTGGADPAGNPTLYDAIQKAHKNSVPVDNIDRAVKRGGGVGGDAVDYIEIMYEAYGPGGVAHPDRVPDRQPQPVGVRRAGGGHAQRRHHGRRRLGLADLRPQGRRRGRQGRRADARSPRTTCSRPPWTPTPRTSTDEGETFKVISDPSVVVEVRKAVQAAGLDYESAEVQFVPQYTKAIDTAEAAEKLFKLLDAIEDLDDVQNVYSNEDVPDEIGEQLA